MITLLNLSTLVENNWSIEEILDLIGFEQQGFNENPSIIDIPFDFTEYTAENWKDGFDKYMSKDFRIVESQQPTNNSLT